MLVAAGSLIQPGHKILDEFNRVHVLLFSDCTIREGLEEEHYGVDLIPDRCLSNLSAHLKGRENLQVEPDWQISQMPHRI